MLKGGYTHISRSFYEKKLTHLESQIVELRAAIFGMVLSGISSNFDFCRALDKQLSGIVGLHAFDVSDELDWSQEDARKWVNAVGNRRGKSSTMMNFVDTCSGFCATLLKKRRMKLAQGQQAKLRRRVTMARQRSTALKRAISSGSNSGNKGGGEMPAGEDRNTAERAPSTSSNSQHSPPPAERQTAPNTHAQHHSPQPARRERTPSPVPAPIRFNRNGDGTAHQKANNSARWTNSSPNINGEEYGQKSPEFERTEMYNRRSPPPKSPDVLHRPVPSPHRSTHKSAPPENGRRKSAGRKESERNETETSNTDSWSSTDTGMGEPQRGRSRGPKRRSTTARRKQMNGTQGASTSAGVSPTNAEHIYANGISSSSTDAGKKSHSANTRAPPSTNVSPRKNNFKDGTSEQLSGIGSANREKNREAENENEEEEEEDELSPLNRLHRRKGMSKRRNFPNPSMKKSNSFSFHNQT